MTEQVPASSLDGCKETVCGLDSRLHTQRAIGTEEEKRRTRKKSGNGKSMEGKCGKANIVTGIGASEGPSRCGGNN